MKLRGSQPPSFPLSGVKTLTLNFEVLRPLLRSRPRANGETTIPDLGAVCLDCGARDKQILIKKHHRNCPHQAWFKALGALDKMLGPEPERRKK